jgi:predicted CxxxxCH...CXXCH cytochrome family protein
MESPLPSTPQRHGRNLLVSGLLLVLLVLTGLGCGKGAGQGTDLGPGYHHPSGWLSDHPAQALADVNACLLCHSTNVLKVGSGIPNCMTAACHHGTLPGYALPGLHGLQAKQAPGPVGGGMAACQLCHGQDFAGGSATTACATCHKVPAPHPPKPWHNPAGSNHASTDPSNGPLCAQCHFPGASANPLGHPAAPAPAGTAPGCFSNTECHGPAAAPHALGSLWKDPTSSAFHGLEAKKDLLYCQSCHGTPGSTRFDGGAAPTKCTTCHAAARAHSTVWSAQGVTSFPGYVASHRTAQNRDNACPVCHDYSKGRTAPDPAAPSCFANSVNAVACHVNGPGVANHPVPFLTSAHTGATPTSFNGDCATCHALAAPSPVTAAPACAACHQAASPLAVGACASCHGRPPAGTLFPNLAGSHASHGALPAASGQCSACHTGSDSGTQAHYDHANGRPGLDSRRQPPAPTAFLASFNAATGPAAYLGAAGTCSNVSCHGGTPTPSWTLGSLNVTTDAGCRQCHSLGAAQGSPQANSPWSGVHALHLGATVSALCTDCHAMGNGTPGANNHFAHLDTPQMEGPAGDTVWPQGAAGNYDKTAQTCTLTCHTHVHAASSWKGGANHPVPYPDAAHTTATQASFTANCGNCHAVSGSSPSAAAPLCSVCHQAASPLSVGACASCHGKPPAGTVFPAVAGSHSKHNALTGVTSTCGVCHSGSDTGTPAHYDHANARPGKDGLRVAPAPAAFLATYKAKAGAATFTPAAQTCSNISCHGAITTPAWATGSIPATDAGCRQCHAKGTALGVPESNVYFSGQHSGHLGSIKALCTDCHVMGNGSAGANNHFKFLGTTQMEGPASDTVTFGFAGATYNATAKTCTLTCHGEGHSARKW